MRLKPLICTTAGCFEIIELKEHDCALDIGSTTLKPGKSGESPLHFFPPSAYEAPALAPLLEHQLIAGKLSSAQSKLILLKVIRVQPTQSFISKVQKHARAVKSGDVDTENVRSLRQYAELVRGCHHVAEIRSTDAAGASKARICIVMHISNLKFLIFLPSIFFGNGTIGFVKQCKGGSCPS
jgi:hypothetical protein